MSWGVGRRLADIPMWAQVIMADQTLPTDGSPSGSRTWWGYVLDLGLQLLVAHCWRGSGQSIQEMSINPARECCWLSVGVWLGYRVPDSGQWNQCVLGGASGA
ncbi:hypothetical protein GCM10022255_044990 [Dactylosporangium darangshiense]|uniref:Uncharacterized protein n=1 Tax=Dactylosporangium darangshiense TaxID=579108 RepID=A0ABP8DAY5_9ACTN